MSDDTIDRLVREADPVPGGHVEGLAGSEADLLTEIVASDDRPRRRTTGHRLGRRLSIGLAAAASAAVVAGLVTSAVVDPEAGPRRTAEAPAAPADTSANRLVYAAATIEVAQDNPRFVVDEPGWRATAASAFTRDEGGITYENAGRQVEVNWYPARFYRTYYDDRTEVSRRTATTVDGLPGSRVTYSTTDVAVMLQPSGRTFTEIRVAGRFPDTAAVLAVLDRIKRVSVDQWLATLPREVVTPARAADVRREILADVPVPGSLDRSELRLPGVNDRYQFGAATVGRVECAWYAQWTRAWATGDRTSAAEAVAALRSARDWDVLRELDRTGDFAEGPWQLADRVSVDDDPAIYAQSVDCPTD